MPRGPAPPRGAARGLRGHQHDHWSGHLCALIELQRDQFDEYDAGEWGVFRCGGAGGRNLQARDSGRDDAARQLEIQTRSRMRDSRRGQHHRREEVRQGSLRRSDQQVAAARGGEGTGARGLQEQDQIARWRPVAVRVAATEPRPPRPPLLLRPRPRRRRATLAPARVPCRRTASPRAGRAGSRQEREA
jgi:hypothetical protein